MKNLEAPANIPECSVAKQARYIDRKQNLTDPNNIKDYNAHRCIFFVKQVCPKTTFLN